MKTLKIDEKWSVEYDETQNDRPVRLLRYDSEMGMENWTNDVRAMFYALLAHEEAAADKRRLTRELDVAMHGEDGAAKQASLCDLIPAATDLRAKLKEQRQHPLSDAVIAEMWPEMNSVEGRVEIRRQYDALIAAEREDL